MAQITVTQHAHSASGTGPASLSGVTAGRVLVAVIHSFAFFGGTPTLSSVSGGGATWTIHQREEIVESGVCVAVGIGGTGGNITVSATGTWENYSVSLYELSADADSYDTGSVGYNGASGNIVCASTGTLASDECIVIFGVTGVNETNGFSFQGGFTEDVDAVFGGWRAGSAHLEVTSTSALTPTCVPNYDFIDGIGACVSIKTGGGGGPTAPTGRRSLLGVGV